jgi:Mrp family chromosome partitioning ATPase
MALPTLTAEQRADALKKAQEARVARKHLLEQVKSGEVTVAQVLDRGKSDPMVGKTMVLAVVLALPGVGAARAATLLSNAGIAEGRRVGGVGSKQHEALINALN